MRHFLTSVPVLAGCIFVALFGAVQLLRACSVSADDVEAWLSAHSAVIVIGGIALIAGSLIHSTLELARGSRR